MAFLLKLLVLLLVFISSFIPWAIIVFIIGIVINIIKRKKFKELKWKKLLIISIIFGILGSINPAIHEIKDMSQKANVGGIVK